MPNTMKKITPKRYPELTEAKQPKKDVYPQLTLPLRNLPEAKKWEIEKTYTVCLELKMISLAVGEDDYNNRAEFEIRGIKVIK